MRTHCNKSCTASPPVADTDDGDEEDDEENEDDDDEGVGSEPPTPVVLAEM